MRALRLAGLLMLLATVLTIFLRGRADPAEPPVDSGLVPAPPEVAAAVRLERFGPRFVEPLLVTSAPGDAQGRLFVVEKPGHVRIVLPDGTLRPGAFLDLSKRVSNALEQGLLGLAFHPRYAENGRLFASYTDHADAVHVVEMRVSKEDPDRVDPASERDLLVLPKRYQNHNGGCVLFGPDGWLYFGSGDGGAGGDPFRNGQNAGSLYGKLLRFDVDAAPEKPAAPEVVAIGLRNPWRFSFDRKTKDLYIADVGQDLYEEVDVAPFDKLEGANFGWSLMEGFHDFRRGANREGLTLPLLEYGHRDGCSITGGLVYRGKELPELDGCYFYADYCTGMLRSFRARDGAAVDSWDWKRWLDPDMHLATLSSFGEDAAGEMFLCSLDGPIWRFRRAKGEVR